MTNISQQQHDYIINTLGFKYVIFNRNIEIGDYFDTDKGELFCNHDSGYYFLNGELIG